MYPSQVSSRVVDRLYALTSRLEADWANVGLSDDFGSRMVEVTLHLLEKHYPSEAHSGEKDRERHAKRILRYVWRRNASRDYIRSRERRLQGTSTTPIPLFTLSPNSFVEPTTDLYAALEHDLCAGELGRALVQELIAHGTAREYAWCYVWRNTGLRWDAITELMRDRFECEVSSVQLRKWAQRHFPTMDRQIRRAFNDFWGHDTNSQKSPSPFGAKSCPRACRRQLIRNAS